MKKNLLKNIFSMVSLKGLEYLLALAILPYLVRVLGLDRYGTIVFMQSIIQYFVIIIDYGFNIITPRRIAITNDLLEQGEIFSSVIICKIILGTFLTLLFLIIYLFTFSLNFIDIKLFAALYLNVIGNIMFPIWFFQGIQKMEYITVINILSRSITVIAIFLFVCTPEDYIIAAACQSLTNVLSGIFALLFLIKKYNYLFLFPSIKYVANTFIEGWEIFISTLAINAYTATNIIVLRLFTNDVIVGYYGAANKIIDSIKGILNPISLAIFPYISQQVIINKSNAILFIRKVLKCYSIFGFIMFFILFIFSDEIVSVLLGVQYEQSIILIKILSAIPFLVAISNVLGTHTLLTFGYNRIYSRILLVSALISIILIIPMSYFFSDKGAAFTMLLTEFCVTLMMYVSLRKLDIHIMR